MVFEVIKSEYFTRDQGSITLKNDNYLLTITYYIHIDNNGNRKLKFLGNYINIDVFNNFLVDVNNGISSTYHFSGWSGDYFLRYNSDGDTGFFKFDTHHSRQEFICDMTLTDPVNDIKKFGDTILGILNDK